VNAQPLRPLFERMYLATHASIPGGPQLPSRLTRLSEEGWATSGNIRPRNLFSAPYFMETMRSASQLFTNGKFKESLTEFQAILQSLPLAVAENDDEAKQLHECLGLAGDYTLALRIEVSRKSLLGERKLEDLGTEEMARVIELASLFTVCQISPQHIILTLRQAMIVAYKAQNFLSATKFAQRLLETNVGTTQQGQQIVAQARKLLVACEARGTEAIQTGFDYREAPESIVLCCKDLTAIPRGSRTSSCAFCLSKHKEAYRGQPCSNCELSEVGAEALGIQFRPL